MPRAKNVATKVTVLPEVELLHKKSRNVINSTFLLLYLRARDGIRTRDPRLGKAILHH